MSSKRGRSPSPSRDIFRSNSIEEQKSVFVAAFSHSLPVKALQGLPEFRTATHRMAAWRKPSRQKSLIATKVLYDLGHDDDGEKWAGARLQHVLEDLKVEGTVVVARWYGGQNIGPIRFTHIENCAKEAIWNWKSAEADVRKEQMVKKQKVDEGKERAELEKSLRERDVNIFMLRGLLADKTAKLEGTTAAPPTPQKAPPDYGKLPIEALKKLDVARDKTIALILKKIDEVEEKLKLVEDLDDSNEDSWKEVGASKDEGQKTDEKVDDKSTPTPNQEISSK